MPKTSSRPESALQLFIIVTGVALLLRALQVVFQQADPLFYNPLGGNLSYLLMGERIAGGEWLPLDGRPFSVSSPLYPWIAGIVFRLVGESDPGALRMAGAGADALMCGLLSLLALRRFGRGPAWATGLLAAGYAPFLYFSTELAPVPFTLLLLVAGLLVIDVGLTRAWLTRPFLRMAGLLVGGAVLLGLAVGTRPNLLLGLVFVPLLPWAVGRSLGASSSLTGPPHSPEAESASHTGPQARRQRFGQSLLLLAGLSLGIAPVPLMNWVSSGQAVLLTTGAGHNFYIGHNPMAQPQYSLPLPLDGDIFESMKSLAESETGRAMADSEVSGWYLRRAVAEIRADPVREVHLLYGRILASVNDFEATTYGSFEYQQYWSPLLRWLPSFAVIFGLALAGVFVHPPRREDLLIWIPWIAGTATVLLFFYIARLRILALPTLLIFAGLGLSALISSVRRSRWVAFGFLSLLVVAGFGLSSLTRFDPDPSNEWNKAGGVLASRGFDQDAEQFFQRALIANRLNPSTFRNLAVLYRRTGRADDADRMQARAEELMGAAAGAAEAFGATLNRD